MQARTLAALALGIALPLAAQQIPVSEVQDPANLMGERVSPPALADTLPINHGAPALEQLLRKLRTRASLMLIVAHPDDEDSGMLTFESRGEGARVAMLTLNRGEGGQNLMSADFNDALGLIRTQELLAEDRYTGTDQFFGTEVDFGFSKTKEEAFRKWTHERVLYDAVRAVRLYRPLVLASVFIGEPTDGHGQHQVAGEIAQEVFLAAADPKVFPEMGLPPWAPLKVYARVPFAQIDSRGMFDYATGKVLPPRFENYVTGKISTTPPTATVTIHEGDKPDIPAFEGKSYIQWARQGLALQKSQIGAGFRIPPAGVFDVGYTLYGSRHRSELPGAHLNSLFEGLDISLPSIADPAPYAPATLRSTLETIEASIVEAQHVDTPGHLDRTVPPLRHALFTLDALIQTTQNETLPPDQKFDLLHELRVKRVQLNDALVLALSLTITSDAHPGDDFTTATPRPAIVTIAESYTGDPIQVRGTLTGPPSVKIRGSVVSAYGSSEPEIDLKNPAHFSTTVDPRGRAMETCPYFERSDPETPFYSLSPTSLRNAPAKPSLSLFARVDSDRNPLLIGAVDRIGNDPVRVVPPVNIQMPVRVGIFTPASATFPVEVDLSTDSLREVDGTLRLELPERWTSSPEAVPFQLHQNETPANPRRVTFLVTPSATQPNASYKIKAQARIGQVNFTKGYRLVGYPGLQSSDFCAPAIYKASAVDVTSAPNLRIAFLPGTGDELAMYLPNLGVTPTLLSAKDLTLDNLKQYDAILLGVRVYAAHPKLQGPGSDPLKRYAEQGGIVIAQYDSGGFNPTSAPFPYTLPGDPAHNVVEEEQPVHILAPENPLLTWPNRITAADFNGWIEERGHGFASDWAPEYTPLLEAHDEGQDPQRGGLLVARTGKGAWIYCAFALYRQLPEGVPGAYRLTANLLSYAKNPHR